MCAPATGRRRRVHRPIDPMKRLPALVLLAGFLAACNDSTTTGGPGDGAAAPAQDAGAAPADAVQDLAASSEATLAAVRAALEAEDVPGAERLCRDRLSREPGDALIAEALVDIYLNLGAGDLARERIEQTLAANPEACRMHFYSGLLHGRKGRLAEAEAAFRKAEACGVSSADLEYNLAVLDHNAGDNARSIERLRALNADYPEWSNVRRELARALVTAGDEASLAEAQVLLDVLSAETADDWRVWQLLGLHSEALGDLPAAKEYFTEALRVGQNPPDAEDDYVRVSRAMIDAGMGEMVETREANTDMPPVSAGMQQRWDEARRKKEAAGSDGQPAEGEAGPPAPGDGAH